MRSKIMIKMRMIRVFSRFGNNYKVLIFNKQELMNSVLYPGGEDLSYFKKRVQFTSVNSLDQAANLQLAQKAINSVHGGIAHGTFAHEPPLTPLHGLRNFRKHRDRQGVPQGLSSFLQWRIVEESMG